jgi:hypothetical protein
MRGGLQRFAIPKIDDVEVFPFASCVMIWFREIFELLIQISTSFLTSEPKTR